jgi:hypothetical protein
MASTDDADECKCERENRLDVSAPSTSKGQREKNTARDSTLTPKANIGEDDPKTVGRTTKKGDNQPLSSSNAEKTNHEKLHQRSPKPCSPPSSLQGKESTNDVASMSSLRNNLRASQLQTPERQRSIDVSIQCSKTPDECDSSSLYLSNKRYSCLWLGTLRIMLILFSSASILSGTVSVFSGRMTVFYYILSSPILWIVRAYMAASHLMLIVVELKIEVPILLPKKTLDNFLHKGYIISFIGLLDSCMSANTTLEQILDELQGTREGPQPESSGYELQGGDAGWKISSARSIRNKVCIAVLNVSSRGLMVCGLLYVLLGLYGWTGESRRRASTSQDSDSRDIAKTKSSFRS